MKVGPAGGRELDAVALHSIGSNPNTRHQTCEQELSLYIGQRLSYPTDYCSSYEQESDPTELATASSPTLPCASWHWPTSSVAVAHCGATSRTVHSNRICLRPAQRFAAIFMSNLVGCESLDNKPPLTSPAAQFQPWLTRKRASYPRNPGHNNAAARALIVSGARGRMI